MTSPIKILIGIATYRRPASLDSLLSSIIVKGASPNGEYLRDVLVVDNDPEGSARVVSTAWLDRGVTYIVEPVPGIAAARNTALEYALTHGYDRLVFVDDDETVGHNWLEHLHSTMVALDAQVICGPVVPKLSSEAGWWVRAGGFFDRQENVTGGIVKWPATNNAIVDLHFPPIVTHLRFGEAFSLTGGEDTDFFQRLVESGGTILWCEEAIVYEDVPNSRSNARWLWRRGMRLGNVSARMLARRHTATFVIAVAILRIAAAAPLALGGAILKRKRVGAALMNIPKGVGMIQAVRGNLTIEYKR